MSLAVASRSVPGESSASGAVGVLGTWAWEVVAARANSTLARNRNVKPRAITWKGLDDNSRKAGSVKQGVTGRHQFREKQNQGRSKSGRSLFGGWLWPLLPINCLDEAALGPSPRPHRLLHGRSKAKKEGSKSELVSMSI